MRLCERIYGNTIFTKQRNAGARGKVQFLACVSISARADTGVAGRVRPYYKESLLNVTWSSRAC